MSILSKLREASRMTIRRDPEVAQQVRETAANLRTNGRLIREIRAVQGQLERSRSTPPTKGAATWTSKPSS